VAIVASATDSGSTGTLISTLSPFFKKLGSGSLLKLKSERLAAALTEYKTAQQMLRLIY
jgi:hypothetical protein